MIIAGVILLIVGFLLVMPSDSTPGSIGNRQVRQGSLHVVGTPGHSASSRRAVSVRVIIGATLLIAGLVLLLLT